MGKFPIPYDMNSSRYFLQEIATLPGTEVILRAIVLLRILLYQIIVRTTLEPAFAGFFVQKIKKSIDIA